MSCSVLGRLAVGFVFLLNVLPLHGHHAILAKFDDAKPMTVRGLVIKVDWANPHAHVFVDVQEGNQIVSWIVEIASIIDLERSGWKRDSLKPGDPLTVQGWAARDGSKQLWGNSLVHSSTGRAVYNVTTTPTPSTAARPTPRWPDGKPRLGFAPGEVGYWAAPSSTVLMETGANVAMDASGLLRNIADVDKVAPFQRWARDLYEYRQRNFLKDDPMFNYCKPPGAVRQFQMKYGNQFLEDKDNGRIFLLAGDGNHDWHFIYTDGRPQRGSPNGDDDNPLYYGRAAGKWEGDTFVVDSIGFNEKFWFTNGGLPHTDQLHLIERFTRTDYNTMRYEVTIDDPGAYTRTWSASWTLRWIPEELPAHYCQDNRP